MKCWNSAFNAYGPRLIIVVVHVGGMKIYVAAVEALRKNERQGETQFTRNRWFSEFASTHWMLMYFFRKFLKNLILFMIKFSVLMLYFLILQIILLYFYYTPLMIIHSCKTILINCGCMFGWVFFFAMDHLIGLSPKTLWKSSFPKNKIYIVLHLLCFTRSYKII
jgi:hypothetical protein